MNVAMDGVTLRCIVANIAEVKKKNSPTYFSTAKLNRKNTDNLSKMVTNCINSCNAEMLTLPHFARNLRIFV